MSTQRLQKILAQAGVASRRAAEVLISEGRVRVNGRIVRELGSRANPARDRVEVDGKRLVSERPVYYLMHKPRGVVTTLDDPEGRKSIKDFLRGVTARVFPVGRLDFHTSGALLLTNDGALAYALLHPTRAVPKVYNAKVEGMVDAQRLELLRTGVSLDDGHKTAPAEVKVLRSEGKSTSLEITITEGKNRQIHRMGEAVGRSVLRLTRIAFAGLSIDGLRAGQLRPLTPLELGELKQTYVTTGRRKPQRAWEDDDVGEPAPMFATEVARPSVARDDRADNTRAGLKRRFDRGAAKQTTARTPRRGPTKTPAREVGKQGAPQRERRAAQHEPGGKRKRVARAQTGKRVQARRTKKR